MKDETIESVANKESKFETPAIAEAAINDVKQGDIIQLERRGFFYVDQKLENGLIHLNYIPDGKTKTMSVISTKVDAKTLSKGEGESKKSKDKKKDKKDKENKKQQKEQTPVEENK
jgi:glutamyl-tRNA synthetase